MASKRKHLENEGMIALIVTNIYQLVSGNDWTVVGVWEEECRATRSVDLLYITVVFAL
jgi:hypothetical protein